MKRTRIEEAIRQSKQRQMKIDEKMKMDEEKKIDEKMKNTKAIHVLKKMIENKKLMEKKVDKVKVASQKMITSGNKGNGKKDSKTKARGKRKK